jgi:Fe-S cluster biogenesis protein NfuA
VEQSIEQRIESTLDTVRPFLRIDGGDVSIVRFRSDGVLELRWEGTCRICPVSPLTLRAGVERAVLKNVPEVRRVEAVVL